MDDTLLEDKGIQPDIWLENTWAEVLQEKDPLLNKAIEILN